MVAPTEERLEQLRALLPEDPKKRVVNAFDLDGTIFVLQWTIEMMFRIVRKVPARRPFIARLRAALKAYKEQRTYAYAPVLTAAVEAIPQVFKGLAETDVRSWSRPLVSELGDRTYLFPRTLLACLVKRPVAERGLIVAITGAPQEVAEAFGEYLGFDLVYGVRYVVRDGVLTGDCETQSVHDKGAVLRKIVERFDINLGASTALGDSASDIPMLDAVGHAFAVNPHEPLLNHARQSEKIVWVNDRQKSGVTVFKSLPSQRFLECSLQQVLPRYVRDGFPDLPGSLPWKPDFVLDRQLMPPVLLAPR